MSTQSDQAAEAHAEEREQPSAESPAPNLEALMHVPLEVSVELGRIKLPLHQVVRIGRGTVLKFQKEADAMVEILANGAVFARGEVVKADGKLGVRITDVVPPAERIRALS